MDETTYRNKPFKDLSLNNFYIVYYEGGNKDAIKDWFFNTKSISFQGPYRSLEYAKKKIDKKSRGAIIYQSENKKMIFYNNCGSDVVHELYEWAYNNSYINMPVLS